MLTLYIVTRRRKRSVFIAPLIAFCKNGQVIDPAGSGKCVTRFHEYKVNPEYLLQQLNNLPLSHVRKNTTTVKTDNFKNHSSSLIQLYWAQYFMDIARKLGPFGQEQLCKILKEKRILNKCG